MPKAEQNATTCCAPLAFPTRDAPPVLPSILELGLLLRTISDQGDYYDEASLAEKKHTRECRNADMGHNLAFAREEALRELILTLPARSLGDVAVQLYLGFLELDFLQNHELDRGEVDGRISKLRRLVAGMLPAAAEAAGLTTAQISNDDIAVLIAREHPAVEA